MFLDFDKKTDVLLCFRMLSCDSRQKSAFGTSLECYKKCKYFKQKPAVHKNVHNVKLGQRCDIFLVFNKSLQCKGRKLTISEQIPKI